MNKHYIWVKAKCSNYYTFIKKLQFISVKILDIKYIDDVVYLKIDNDDLEKLQKYLVSYKFKKERNLGLYHFWDIVKQRHIWVICLVIGLISYFFMTHLVVRINVVHEKREIRELILDELESRGVKILTLKKDYETLDRIKKEILDQYPDKLDWLEIEVEGMVYNVRVEERIITDTNKDEKICNLVAKKNGMVSNIKISLGEAVVDLNDYVREGDILVSGIIKHNEVEKRSVCASGEVYATVWYTIDVSIPFYYNEYEKTGKKKYNFVWDNKGNKKRILKKRFADFESSVYPLLKVFQYGFYLEREEETEKIEKKYSEEEALNMALEKASQSILKKLDEKDKIIDKKVLKKEVNDSTMDVEIFVIAEELISVEAEIIPDDDSVKGVE